MLFQQALSGRTTISLDATGTSLQAPADLGRTMAQPLTSRDLRSLRPGSVLTDGLVGGLSVRVSKRGVGTWTLKLQTGGGKQRRITLGQVVGRPDHAGLPGFLTLEQARRAAYLAKDAAVHGEFTAPMRRQPAAPDNPILGAALDRYFDDPNMTGLRTADRMRAMLQGKARPLLATPIREITRADIRAVLAPMDGRIIGNRVHSGLRTFWRWAMDRELATESPLPAQRPRRTEPSRARTLTDSELVVVWRATAGRQPRQRDVIRMLILLGQRREEVAGARWAEIDRERWVWTLPSARYKTGIAHAIPLVPAVQEILQRQPVILRPDGTPSPWIFTVSGMKSLNMTKEGWELSRITKVEVPKWVVHDLRRTARTGLAALGVTMEVAELIFHPRTGIQGTYDRAQRIPEKREALQRWAEHVRGLVGEADFP